MSGKMDHLRLIGWIAMIVLIAITVGACKKGTTVIFETIVLDTGQSSWNLSASDGSEMLEVFLVGDGVEKIVLDSIEMKGDNPSASTLKAASAELQSSRVRAEFRKKDVHDLLSNPSAGSTHNITIIFRMIDSSVPSEVHSEVKVDDAGDDSESSVYTLEIDPDEWDLNFAKSKGTVEAFIEGEGIENIDLSSIEMSGDNPAAAVLPADSASINNNHVHARFPKSEVIGLLLDPAEGTVHTITVSFLETGGTERLELTAQIVIVDEEDDGGEIDPSDLELEIDPVEWSLNFTKSSGTVEAFIEGEGIENIDLTTIVMTGDNPAAASLAAESASIKGNKVHAKFPKNGVIDLLLNPVEGSAHTITVSFYEIGGTELIELTVQITIEEDDDGGDDGGEEPEPTELSLQLAPGTWNTNFSKSSGSVQAIIRGDGIENIDLDSLEMTGDNPAAEALTATSASLHGNHVQADFPKNLVLGLLLNPGSGSKHIVTVSFTVGGGGRTELSTEVKVNGK
jgi:hypothetical protein